MDQDSQKQCTTDSKETIQNYSFSFFERIINETNHVFEIEKRVEGCVLRCKYKCSACYIENYCRFLFGEKIPYLLEPDTIQLKKEYPELFI